MTITLKVKVLVTQSCPTLCDPTGYSPPGFSVKGILQAGILEWVAIPFFRGSSWPRDQTQVSCITGKFFIIWGTREASTSIFSFLYTFHINILFITALPSYILFTTCSKTFFFHSVSRSTILKALNIIIYYIIKTFSSLDICHWFQDSRIRSSVHIFRQLGERSKVLTESLGP